MPVCHETGIKMAIHPDDPPWDIFGLPRLLVDKESIGRFLKMVDDPYNCLCLCSGSLGANKDNDVPDIIRTYCDRIAFAHIRNVKHFDNGDFTEASHRDCDGDTQILEIMRAYHDCGFDGYIRIMDAISGENSVAPATDSMTVPLALCICGAAGIC